MLNTLLVSLAITAGVIALAGVPLRCWQFATGRFRSRIPQHALARATFRLFAFIMRVALPGNQPGKALLNSATNRGNSASGSELIPAAACLPPPVSNLWHSASAPRG